jgi:hypothetical protein
VTLNNGRLNRGPTAVKREVLLAGDRRSVLSIGGALRRLADVAKVLQ